jgi:hypothetical protein
MPALRGVAAWTLAVALLLVATTFTGANLHPPTAGVNHDPAEAPRAAMASDAAGPNYTLKFGETGLPPETGWSIALNTSNNTNWSWGFSKGSLIEFIVPKGNYTYWVGAVGGYTNSPTTGTAKVVNKTVRYPVEFTPSPPPTFPVWFNESGLPGGTLWWVWLNGTAEFSKGPSVLFFAPDGTYSYMAGLVNDYSAIPASGSVTVNGTTANRTVTYSPFPKVLFVETGLKSGTVWSVTLNGTTEYSSSDFLSFSIASGTYSFGVGTVSEYTANPSSGSFLVSGNETKSVTFSAVTVLGLSPLLGYAVLSALITLLIVIVLGLLLLAIRRRKRGPTTGAPKSYTRPASPPPPPAPKT